MSQEDQHSIMGHVSVPEPDAYDEAEVAVRGLVVSGCQSAAVLELREAAFDEVSERVEVAVDGALVLAVALGRDDGSDAPCVEIGQDGVGVVALVCKENLGLWSWLGHDRCTAFDVAELAASQHNGDGQAQTVGPQMDLGREVASRAPKTFAFRA
jgi:hypothetical protein